MDSFYTPPELATLLVNISEAAAPSRIADFAAGDGALLKSARARWPRADLTAMDVDGVAIAALKNAVPNATLLHDDFFHFSGGARSESQIAPSSFDLILLNPPFSCRGNTRFTVEIEGRPVAGSRALAFAAKALSYLQHDGELIAILPSSCLTSERDAPLRAALERKWEIKPIGSSKSTAFPRCSVTINVVHIKRRANSYPLASRPTTTPSYISRGRLLVMRGTIPDAKGTRIQQGVPFIHSTDLIQGRLAEPTRWSLDLTGRLVAGTAVLLPRVGRPKLAKVVLKAEHAPVVLSDCVMALKTPERSDESDLHDLISRNWDQFRQLWSGSCAPYVTLSKLEYALEGFGYDVSRVRSMAHDQRPESATRDIYRITPRPSQPSQKPELHALSSG